MTPRVSIVMPVRNEAPFLEAAIRSILCQTLREWELIAVDDGSTDDTPTILAEAAGADGRIRPTPNRGRGLVDALNTGISLCRAPLIARMDGDDVSHPRRLELQLRFLDTHPEIGLVASAFRHFPRQGLRVGMLAYERWQNGLVTHDQIMRDRYVESPFVHPTVVMRRSALDAAGGWYRDRGWPEDYDLWLGMARAGVRFHSLPDTLFFWRDHPTRSTRTMEEYAARAFRRCKIHHLTKEFLKGVGRVTLIGAGKEGRLWRQELEEVGISVGCWIDLDPRKVGRTLHGAPVIHADRAAEASPPFLVTVGTRGARDGIRRWMESAGIREGIDAICVT